MQSQPGPRFVSIHGLLKSSFVQSENSALSYRHRPPVTAYRLPLFLNDLLMEPCFFSQELFFLLHVVWICYAAIDRAYSCALRFLMKACTLRTFSCYDIIKLIRYRCLRSLRIHSSSVF